MPYGVTRVLWKDGFRFCSRMGTTEITCDESPEGERTHPSAPELLMAALGSCIGSVLVTFADRRDLDLSGMTIDLAWDLAENPHRIGEITIGVDIPLALDQGMTETMKRVANACLIHNTLTHPPKIKLELRPSE